MQKMCIMRVVQGGDEDKNRRTGLCRSIFVTLIGWRNLIFKDLCSFVLCLLSTWLGVHQFGVCCLRHSQISILY